MDHIVIAVIVFGVLLAISLYGLFRSNAASERLNASTELPRHGTYRPQETGGR